MYHPWILRGVYQAMYHPRDSREGIYTKQGINLLPVSLLDFSPYVPISHLLVRNVENRRVYAQGMVMLRFGVDHPFHCWSSPDAPLSAPFCTVLAVLSRNSTSGSPVSRI